MFSSFGNDSHTSLIGVPLNQTISLVNFWSIMNINLTIGYRQLVVQGNTIFTSLIVTFNWTVEIIPVQFNVAFSMTRYFPPKALSRLTSGIVFNDAGKVIEYDAVLVRSNWILPLVLPKMVPRLAEELGLPVSTDPLFLATKRAAIDICSAHDQFCTTPDLTQYNSTNACLDFIMNQVPFGDIWQAGQNTGISVPPPNFSS
jgi:hypothetical protein